jgi:ABC-type transporter Mla maintaining outer membrane lipid asymmetry ATPase subunit MlaF
VTHDLESAYFVGQKLVLIREGEVYFEGTADEFQNSDLEFVKMFRTGGKAGIKYEQQSR